MRKTSVLVMLCCFLGGRFCATSENLTLTLIPNSTLADQEGTPKKPLETETVTTATVPPSIPMDHKPEVRPTSPPNPPPLSPTSSTYSNLFKKEHLFMVTGGLLLACAILLISTLLLAQKVCQLSRRIKMLSSHSDPMSTAKYGKESAEKKGNKSETDAKETTVLMANLNPTCDETGDSGNEPSTENKKEEKEKACENGVEKKESDAKKEEAKETPPATEVIFGDESKEASASEDKKKSKDSE